MAEMSGFFPSTTANPRKYGNDWLNKLFDCVISDGVFATPEGKPSNYLQVTSTGGMNISIKSGWGRFKSGDETFFYQNDGDMTKTLVAASGVARTDYVVVRVDRNEQVKRVYIDLKTGNLSTGEVPTLVKSTYITEYLLAKIKVGGTTTAISQSDITDCRGTSDCPWAIPVAKQVNIESLMAQFETAYWDWYDNVTKNISREVMVTQRSALYQTSVVGQNVITIPTELDYQTGDMLSVYVNGMKINEGEDYVVRTDGKIRTTLGFPVVGTEIEFQVVKNVDATEAAQYVSRLVNVENILARARITDDSGNAKITIQNDMLTELANLSAGFYTVFAATNVTGVPRAGNSVRGIYHKVTSGTAWLLCGDVNGSLYYNAYYEGAWRGWRAIYEYRPALLWDGGETGFVMQADQAIYPSKKLSECRNGWVLMWSGFENGKAVNSRIVTQVIPKISCFGSNPITTSQLMYIAIPTEITEAQTGETIGKQVYIRDEFIAGHAYNSKGKGNYYVLRAVVEY